MISFINLFEVHRTRLNITPGMKVSIVLKKDQGTDKRVTGIVQRVLSPGPYHTRGIKVRLEDGSIGRVQSIIKENENGGKK